MNTLAVVLEEPERLVLSRLPLPEPGEEDVVIDIEWSGISTGTERLLWLGRMPPFPGLGYPLVPGYESVGRIREAGLRSGARVGDRVFVPGARCYGDVRGLFGGASSRVVVPGAKAIPFEENLAERGVLLALAATAYHALNVGKSALPELVVGHGVLGRLLARLIVALGGDPVVWETNTRRAEGAAGYRVIDPAKDTTRGYASICDVSGDSKLLDTLISKLSPGGEIILAGFYSEPLSFAFPPAFMREARLRVAAEWKQDDLVAVRNLIETGALSLDGLITHREPATAASNAYRTAFTDPDCLKMILDWRSCS
ncbi:MAG: chlorophyll synthesis pathway protein BchC [Hyphomicrobium sp.]|jgi:3-hydroxyethyl bacteriochlorophyllide a dehydrogenase|nr:chlorophyll synthesis pathway protein BchC [Hyphomicrobium sp.]